MRGRRFEGGRLLKIVGSKSRLLSSDPERDGDRNDDGAVCLGVCTRVVLVYLTWVYYVVSRTFCDLEVLKSLRVSPEQSIIKVSEICQGEERARARRKALDGN